MKVHTSVDLHRCDKFDYLRRKEWEEKHETRRSGQTLVRPITTVYDRY